MYVREINGRKYIYQSFREGGKPRSRIVGPVCDFTIMVAECASADRECRREERAERAREVERVRSEIREAEAPVIAMVRQVDAIVRRALESAGYHNPSRTQWRRRRMSSEIISSEIIKPTTTPSPDNPALAEIRARSREGESRAAALSIMVDQVMIQFMPEPGDPEPGRTLAARKRKMDQALATIAQTARDLAGPDPTEIERILAERAAYCQYDLERIDAEFEASRTSRDKYKPQFMQLLDMRDRARTRAHNRMVSALTALARVRAIDLRGLALQVNIGQNQQIAQVVNPPEAGA